MLRVRNQIGLTEELQDRVIAKMKVNKPVGIAVLDTGICAHPDFEQRIILFRDFVNNKNAVYDDSGHGTHVAGCIAGSGKASGGKYRGMNPCCNLIIGKVLDTRGDGSVDQMIKALEWILSKQKEANIKIVNISIGMDIKSSQEKMKRVSKMLDELWARDILIIGAAGNAGPLPMTISMLAAGKQVITVGCHEGGYFGSKANLCENYSSRGPSMLSNKKPDLVAPGTDIISCNVKYRKYGRLYKNAYIPKSGTSMSTAVISGGTSILMQLNPDLEGEEVKNLLLQTAKDLKEPWNKQGKGMIQMNKLLEGY